MVDFGTSKTIEKETNLLPLVYLAPVTDRWYENIETNGQQIHSSLTQFFQSIRSWCDHSRPINWNYEWFCHSNKNRSLIRWMNCFQMK